MAEIYPGEKSQTAVARELLNIVGPERAAEIRTGSVPFHFTVPEDVAVEYQRRVEERAKLVQDAEAARESEADTPAETPVEDPKAETPVEDKVKTDTTKGTTTKAAPASKTGK